MMLMPDMLQVVTRAQLRSPAVRLSVDHLSGTPNVNKYATCGGASVASDQHERGHM